ncbi:galactokinase [candidate division KSB1 bacterium]|nr:MAG: galactokinase [candidate division KSB1 bacterium]
MEKLKQFVKSIKFKDFVGQIYGSTQHDLDYQTKRYLNFVNSCSPFITADDAFLFSVPGRIEVGGNHTDHNRGRVIASSVNLDAICAAVPADNNEIVLYSQGYEKPFIVDLQTSEPRKEEQGTTSALIRGICSKFTKLGYKTSGFIGFMQSDVLVGSGLSSSAVIEILIGTILNTLFNDNSVDPVTLAKIGQYAENVYFGKPCGLMDQTACSVGGIITIDFKDPENPVLEKVQFDFADYNYRVLIVNTGGNHADLTEDYASIPGEMKQVARFFGKEVLREVSIDQILSSFNQIRESLSDRALLRALHFLNENDRVANQVEALRSKDIDRFLQIVNESGDSSFKYLQNIYSTHNVEDQSMSLALALSEDFIRRTGSGACRVHGGGFAGTIQAFIQTDYVQDYIDYMEKYFGKGAVYNLKVRDLGALFINPLM